MTMYRLFFLLVSISLYCSTMKISIVDAFAAKKNPRNNNNNNKKKSAIHRGFGAPPISLDDVLAQFPSRLPTNADEQNCPCDSGQLYKDCCRPFHDQTRLCTSPIDVLRSRYSAFCYRNIRHIMSTTHETCRDWNADPIAWAKELNRDGMFDSFEFVQLQIREHQDEHDDEQQQQQHQNLGGEERESFIEFQVTLRGRSDENKASSTTTSVTAGLETVVKERSKFLRNVETGVWSYASGDVTSEVAGLEDTILNP